MYLAAPQAASRVDDQMSVETAPWLANTVKAKLQVAGIMAVDDLWRICASNSPKGHEASKSLNVAEPCLASREEAVSQLTARCGSLSSQEAGRVFDMLASAAAGSTSALGEHEERVTDCPAERREPGKRARSGGRARREEECERHSPVSSSPSQSQSSNSHTPLKDGCFNEGIPQPTSRSLRTFSLRDVLEGRGDSGGGGWAAAFDKAGSACAAGSAIATFSRALDYLLGGRGVPRGLLTELSGSPGVGKTQMLMQLAVSSLIPTNFGGLATVRKCNATEAVPSDFGQHWGPRWELHGGCVFVDTEGSFVASRFHEIATAAVVHVRTLALQQAQHRSGFDALGAPDPRDSPRERAVTAEACRSGPTRGTGPDRPTISEVAECFSVEYVLTHTYYMRVTTLAGLIALVHSIPAMVAAHPEISFVAIDSIAFPFRAAGSSHDGISGTGVAATPAYTAQAPSTTSQSSLCTSASMNGNRLAQQAALTGYSSRGSGGVEARLAAFSCKPAQRNRLLFLCGEQLQCHAQQLNLAIAVSNHVTTRRISTALFQRLRCPTGSVDGSGPDGEAQASSHAGLITGKQGTFCGESEAGDDVTVLVPALGDTWACCPSIRVLLCRRHQKDCAAREATLQTTAGVNGNTICSYCDPAGGQLVIPTRGSVSDHDELEPAASGAYNGNVTSCLPKVSEDVVFVSEIDGVSQHRVARVLKHPTRVRGSECCFTVNKHGIRNAERAIARCLGP